MTADWFVWFLPLQLLMGLLIIVAIRLSLLESLFSFSYAGSVWRIAPATFGILVRRDSVKITFNDVVQFVNGWGALSTVVLTVSPSGAERVEASELVELDKESISPRARGNVSFIHFRYSITSSVTRIILPNILYE